MSGRWRSWSCPGDSHRPAAAWFAARCLVGLLAASAGTALASDPVAIEAVRVGIHGAYKLGKWTQVAIDARTFDQAFHGRLVAQTTDPNGVAVEYVRDDLSLPPSTLQVCTIDVKFGQATGDLVIRFERDRDETVSRCRIPSSERSRPLPASQQLVLVLGVTFGSEESIRQIRRHTTWVDCSGERSAELPRNWLGYSSVDAVFLATSRESEFDLRDDAQGRALKDWIHLGGRVVACGASRAKDLFSPIAPYAWLVPGEVRGVVPMRQTSGIEQFTEATVRLDQMNTSGVRTAVPMADVLHPRGRVEATEGFGSEQSATVIRGAVGLGRVVFVAFDLDQPPFTDWKDLPRLLGKLMSFVLDEVGDDESLQSALGPVAHVGYFDLVGQLRHALDQFPGVKLIPFSWIAALTAIYILIIGPLDYWLVHRWGRPEWTWLTFGMSVVAFTLLAIGLASGWKGHDFHGNQSTLVDLDLERGWLRGTTWAHVYSPRTQSVSLRTEPRAPFQWTRPPRQVTGWHGLPGDGFGGLDRRKPAETFNRPYQSILEFDDAGVVDGVWLEQFPIAAWSSQSLLGQWWGRIDMANATSRLTATPDGTLSGEIDNPLPVDVDDTYLFYGRWAYPLGKLTHSGTIRPAGAAIVDLQTLLTQRTVVEGRNVTTPWNQSSSNVERIMQMLAFFEAANGRAYTRLDHRFQRAIDWSDHLATGRAVLWGRSRDPGAQLLLDGHPIEQTQDWTYYRVLIPVAHP